MGADVLAKQGVRASATMMFTMLNRINSVLARQGLIHCDLMTPYGDIELGQHWLR